MSPKHWGALAYERLGKFGVAGLALLSIAGLAWALLLVPLQWRTTTLASRNLSDQPMADTANVSTAAYGKSLADFYSRFPDVRHYAPQLSSLYQIARKDGFTIEKSAYHASMDGKSTLMAYELDIPIKGSYTQIRGFLRDVLQRFPTMALSRITLRRSRIQESTIEAQVHLAWYLRNDQAIQ